MKSSGSKKNLVTITLPSRINSMDGSGKTIPSCAWRTEKPSSTGRVPRRNRGTFKGLKICLTPLPGVSRRLKPATILMQELATYTTLPVKYITSRSRQQPAAYARFIYAAVASGTFHMNDDEIGAVLGRDRSTVWNMKKKAEALADTLPLFKKALDEVTLCVTRRWNLEVEQLMEAQP